MRNEKLESDVKDLHLESRPTPTSLDTPLRGEADIAAHRRLYCGHYSNCLNQSVREGWAGFSCMYCPLRDYAGGGPRSEAFASQRRNSAPE